MNNTIKEIEQVLSAVASDMSHATRTPLSSIQGGAGGTNKFLIDLLTTYDTAKKHKLNIPDIDDRHLGLLKNTLPNIVCSTIDIQKYIDDITIKLKQLSTGSEKNERFSLINTVKRELDSLIIAYGDKRFTFDFPDSICPELVGSQTSYSMVINAVAGVIARLSNKEVDLKLVNKPKQLILSIACETEVDTYHSLNDFIELKNNCHRSFPLDIYLARKLLDNMGIIIKYRCDNKIAIFEIISNKN